MVVQEILEAEMEEALGAKWESGRGDPLGHRSGYYRRGLVTRVGKLELRVPQDRSGRCSTEVFDGGVRTLSEKREGVGGGVE